MSDNTIPEYLQPALAQLEKARAAHLENARLMDETVTAIERAEQEKNALAQADGNDADDWRTAFRAAGGVLSDELKQRHIERVARRELVQEYDNLAVVLNFERERLKGACDSTATAYRKAHHHLLSLYAEHELEHALNETCEALVRAMHLSILVQENPLANTTGHQGYVAPDKAVMQQVGRTEYVEVTFENGRIILTPMQVRPADAVREKLAALGITEQDVEDAISWSRGEKA